MMDSKATWKVLLTRLVTLFLVAISIYQVWDTVNGWNERPIDSFTSELPKHEFPFPSVTICPEGFSLWEGVRTLLNKLEFSDKYRSLLPLTYRAFLKRKMEVAPYLFQDLHIDDCFGQPGLIVNKSR